AEYSRLAIGVDEQLAQGQPLTRAVRLDERSDRLRIEAEGSHLGVGQVPRQLECGVEDIDRRDMQRATSRRNFRGTIQDLARVARQHYVRRGVLQLRGGVR